MTTTIPSVITELISAQNQLDTESFVKCFSEDAIVQDEGQTYVGKEEIRKWNETTNAKYQTYLEAQNVTVEGERITLSVIVSGTFEGSPIPLKYYLHLKGEKIVSLRIHDQ